MSADWTISRCPIGQRPLRRATLRSIVALASLSLFSILVRLFMFLPSFTVVGAALRVVADANSIPPINPILFNSMDKPQLLPEHGSAGKTIHLRAFRQVALAKRLAKRGVQRPRNRLKLPPNSPSTSRWISASLGSQPVAARFRYFSVNTPAMISRE